MGIATAAAFFVPFVSVERIVLRHESLHFQSIISIIVVDVSVKHKVSALPIILLEFSLVFVHNRHQIAYHIFFLICLVPLL